MATQIIAKNYVIGPATIHYRDEGDTGPWTGLGATLDAMTFRIISEWFVPDNLQGIKGPVKGLDVLRRLNAEVEFTLPDFTGDRMDLVIPGARTTAETHADAGGSPGSTTVATATQRGDTSVVTADATNFAVGDFFRIGSGAGVLVEYRQITAVDTNTLSFRDGLLDVHAVSEEVVETTGDYRTKVESSVYTRMPDSVYREWAMVYSNGNGFSELRLPSGIAFAETTELSVDDNSLSGLSVMISGRYNGTDLSISPFEIYSAAN